MADAIEAAILGALGSSSDPLNTYALSQSLSCTHDAVKGVVNSLEADGYVSKASVTLSYWELTEEGE
eukprot:CAMPEP_0197552052 /NCGR_PEP_ID=MMETSP1320-20131121/5725_1 /TAXON_ID=91990 /ORGANISM="Bolidomonas sp., Strain RCC2347" /LENGTH=66 /DNA_ID=CAMNT_0043112621 /DNA_START=49 /DNA_END=246 /DNA_ORIENTATION=-